MANDEIANALSNWGNVSNSLAPSYGGAFESSVLDALSNKTQVQQVQPSSDNEISSARFESAYQGLYEGAKANEVAGINNAMLEAQSPEQRQIYNQNQIASLQKQNEYLSQAKDHENKYAEAVHLGLVGAIMGIFDKDYDADYQAIMANNARAGANTEAKIGQNQAQEQAINLLTANGVNPLTQGWTNEVDQWAQQYSQQLTAQKEANARKASGANDAYKAVTDRLNVLRQWQDTINDPTKQVFGEAQSTRDANVRLREADVSSENSIRDAEVKRETNQLNLMLEEGRNARLDKEIADNKAQRDYLYKALGQKTTEMFLTSYQKAEGNKLEWARLNVNKYTADKDLQKALINFAKSQNSLQTEQLKGKNKQTPNASTMITEERKRGENIVSINSALSSAPVMNVIAGGEFANNPDVITASQNLGDVQQAIKEIEYQKAQGLPVDEAKLTEMYAVADSLASTINSAKSNLVESQETEQGKAFTRSLLDNNGIPPASQLSNATGMVIAGGDTEQAFTDQEQGYLYNEVVRPEFQSYLNEYLLRETSETASKIKSMLAAHGLLDGGYLLSDSLGLGKVMLKDSEVNKEISKIFSSFLRERVALNPETLEEETTFVEDEKGYYMTNSLGQLVTTRRQADKDKDPTIVDLSHQRAFDSVAKQAFINVINELNLPENNRSLMGPTTTINPAEIDFSRPDVIVQVGNKLIANGWEPANIDNALDKFLQPQYWQQAYQQWGEASRGYTPFESAWNLIVDNRRFLGASLQSMFNNPTNSRLYNKLAGYISQGKHNARSPMGQVATLVGQSHRVDTKQKEVAAQQFGSWWDSNVGSKLTPAANQAYKNALTKVFWDKLVDYSNQGGNK